jgi:hypothetical protein
MPIFNWFKKFYQRKKSPAKYDLLWEHTHWPSADDGFEIIQVDHTSTNKMFEDVVEKITERSKLEHPELWNEPKKKVRRKKVPHPHKGKRKGRRKVGSHIRRARHKRKHAKR